MPVVTLPTPLRPYAAKQAEVSVSGATVDDALGDLMRRHPELRRHLYGDDGKLRTFVNVYVNDEDIRYLGKGATPLKDGDRVSIIPAIAGGRP